MAYVYTYTRLDKNEIFYVGIGSDANYKRAKNKSLRTDYFKKIINKYDYKLDIVFDNLTLEEACQKEIELISLYGRRDLGTGTLINFTDGGEGRKGTQNRTTPIYQIDLNGNILKEWKNTSLICVDLKIHRQALYKALSEKSNTCKDFIWIYKEKFSQEKLNYILEKTLDSKKRMSASGGKKSFKVYQYDLKENLINVFNSIKEASTKTNTRYSCISSCVNNLNNRKIANKFIWKK